MPTDPHESRPLGGERLMLVVTNSRTGDRHHFGSPVAFKAWLSHSPHRADVLNVSEITAVGRRTEERALTSASARSSVGRPDTDLTEGRDPGRPANEGGRPCA